MKHPSKVVKVGDQVESVVLDVKPKERRVSLGIKQLEADPWTTVADRYAIGSVVEGRVRKLTDFGAFIEIEEGIDGLVHISDLSWTKRVKHPSEVVKKGQLVQAVILNIDAPNRRLSLGVKQLQPDAWESFFRTHQVGDVVRGRVCRAANFGVFVELAPGVEGLCHRSEIPGVFRPPARRIASADRRRNGFQSRQAQRGREENRPERSCADRRRGENQTGGLPAPRRGRHHDHRRSNEHQSKD